MQPIIIEIDGNLSIPPHYITPKTRSPRIYKHLLYCPPTNQKWCLMEGCDIAKQISRELDRFQENVEYKFFMSMVKCVEDMFEHQYLFMHREFGEAVRRHPKGYVPFQFVLQQPPFLELLAKNDLNPFNCEQRARMGQVLHKWIREYSKKLWSNAGNVRRMSPYNHQEITPVYVENIPKSNNHYAFEVLLASKCSVSKIEYDDEYSWAWVYTNDPKSLYELNGFSWDSLVKENADEDQRVPNLKVFTQEEIQKSECRSWPVSDERFQEVYFKKDHLKYPALKHFNDAQDYYEDQEDDDC